MVVEYKTEEPAGEGPTLAFRSKRRVTLPELPAASPLAPGDAAPTLAPPLATPLATTVALARFFAGLAWPWVPTLAWPLWLAPAAAGGAVSRKKVRTGRRRPR